MGLSRRQHWSGLPAISFSSIHTIIIPICRAQDLPAWPGCLYNPGAPWLLRWTRLFHRIAWKLRLVVSGLLLQRPSGPNKTSPGTGFPGSPVVRTSRFHCQGPGSISGQELGSYNKPCCSAAKKQAKNKVITETGKLEEKAQ